jgi:quercetin dioxygenase-like cupin family protein
VLLSQPSEVPPRARVPKRKQTITRSQDQTSAAGSPDTFTGEVRVDTLFPASETAPYSGGYVTFQPGVRSAWHTHPAGQRLVVTEGVGRTQQWGGPLQEIRAGDGPDRCA